MNKEIKRKIIDKSFYYLTVLAVVISLGFLLFLFGSIFKLGISKINFHFIFGEISLNPSDLANTGIFVGILGSLYTIFIVMLLAIPTGIGAAIYLEEYMDSDSKMYKILDVVVSNLNGVPSVVYGLLGSLIFIGIFRGTLIAAGLTLSVLILPVIIVSSQEALKTVPSSLKEAAYALGFTKFQVIRGVTLPYSFGVMLTGVILAISRAIGEAAPLIVIGVAVAINYVPVYLTDKITTLPILINEFTSSPSTNGLQIAAATAIVLLVILLTLNAIAVVLRGHFNKKIKG